MTSTNLWRTLAVTAIAGWAITGLGWAVSSSFAPPESSAKESQSERTATQRQRRSRAASAQRPDARLDPASGPHNRATRTRGAESTPNLDELKQEARQEALAELAVERAERRQERSEHHVNRLLDEVATFAEANDLSPKQQAALEVGMEAMHDRLEELRPDGPPGPGGPPEDVLQKMRASHEQLQADALDALQDADLAAEFAEMLTPRPLRDRGSGIARRR